MKNRNLLVSLLILFIGGTIFMYITAKAGVSSFTHDESYKYLHYVHSSFPDLLFI